MNLPRIRLQDAMAAARGGVLAHGNVPVELAYLEAIAATQEEAEEMYFDVNAQRAQARAIAKVRRR